MTRPRRSNCRRPNERRLPEATLSAEEVESVLSGPDVRTPLGLRDRAILEVFYSLAIRRRELIGLRVADVDGSRKTVFVRQGKGAKDRYVPIGERAVIWVRRYQHELFEEAPHAPLGVHRAPAQTRVEHLAGLGARRDEWVIAADVRVAERSALLVLARHLTDRRVDVDDEAIAPWSRPHRPGTSHSAVTRSSWRTWPKVKERRNVPSVEGAMTR